MLPPIAKDQIRRLEKERENLKKAHDSLWRELAPMKDTTSEKYFEMRELTKRILDINHEIFKIGNYYRNH